MTKSNNQNIKAQSVIVSLCLMRGDETLKTTQDFTGHHMNTCLNLEFPSYLTWVPLLRGFFGGTSEDK